MGKTYVRVDDRLIHGQTVVAWCPTLGIKEIIAVDDASAQNPTLRSIMTMGVPSQYRTHIVTTDEAKALLKQEADGSRLVIVKFPCKLKELENEIQGCEQIMLGNIAKRPDTVHKVSGATGIFYLSDEDVKEIDHLVETGMKVSFYQLPTTTETTWESFKKTI